MEAYTVVDYTGLVIDRRPTSSHCTFLCGKLVTWRSKKQNVIVQSSDKAKFRAMKLGFGKLLWMNRIL